MSENYHTVINDKSKGGVASRMRCGVVLSDYITTNLRTAVGEVAGQSTMAPFEFTQYDILLCKSKHSGALVCYVVHFDSTLQSDVDGVERFRLTLRFFDDVSTAS